MPEDVLNFLMSEEAIRVVISCVVGLLVVLLIYRIKAQIRRMIESEIYRNFPAVKNKMEDFNNRLDFLKTQLEMIEQKAERLKQK